MACPVRPANVSVVVISPGGFAMWILEPVRSGPCAPSSAQEGSQRELHVAGHGRHRAVISRGGFATAPAADRHPAARRSPSAQESLKPVPGTPRGPGTCVVIRPGGFAMSESHATAQRPSHPGRHHPRRVRNPMAADSLPNSHSAVISPGWFATWRGTRRRRPGRGAVISPGGLATRRGASRAPPRTGRHQPGGFATRAGAVDDSGDLALSSAQEGPQRVSVYGGAQGVHRRHQPRRVRNP